MEPNWRSFAPITSYDKAGYIWIAMLYGMTVSILILAIRIWYKQSAFGKDDSLFVAASVRSSTRPWLGCLLTLLDRSQ